MQKKFNNDSSTHIFRLMFAILAVNIVGGKLGYCGIPSTQTYFNINETTVKL